jgi:CheY-like chemotaxis protein
MSRRRVLVVDDEGDIRMSVGLALQLAGYEVLEAATGEQAVRGVVERSPDAVLLDLRLPDIDGWGVLERLAELGRFPQVPVVIGSADAAPASRQRALDAGCAGYLVKPFEPAALIGLLEQPAAH